MFKTALFAVVFPVLLTFADPVPDAPSPGEVFNEGSTCHIGWAADTTGIWKTMNIELMTGDNFNMVHLTTVATVDGTDATKTTFDYPCPSVTPNSAIYFYQFSSPASSNLTWTGRFAIADASGNTTPPSESTQPDGEAISWGTGALTDPSSASAAPTYLASGSSAGSTSASGSTVIVTSSASTSTTSVSATTSSTSSPTLTTVRTSIPPASAVSTSSAGSTSSASVTTTTASANSASAAMLDFQARGFQALVALTGTALVFVTMF